MIKKDIKTKFSIVIKKIERLKFHSIIDTLEKFLMKKYHNLVNIRWGDDIGTYMVAYSEFEL